jgi:D-alanyl-lipoteichoic acid acyltransferase DltB (MBOAT superfamily)
MLNPPASTIPLPAAKRAVAPSLADAGRLSLVGFQLAIILLLARGFHIESPAFYAKVLPLAAGGFFVNHLLPLRYRSAFFAALGVAGIIFVFGAIPAAWLIGLGVAMIGMCHLPVAFRWRVVAVSAVAAVLMVLRAGLAPAPWPDVIWPIFGSIFMFRLAIYLYDLKHRGPSSPGLTFSYFFLLPNIVFPLFPVIDFHTFRRTYYDRDAFDIYNEGVRWILRGLTHLVAYRLIYQYVALSPASVESTAEIVQYLVGNFGLYLRVSGQFHVAIGLLHLFGFRLPETHRFFYLASSFSDLWRRINIYWKDFMQKMVYLPVMFKLKRKSETTALVGATVAVVIATWFLHSYQWFWLLGIWLFSVTDVVFWLILGAFLIANTLREQRRGRARQITARAPSTAAGVRHALQTAAMFSLMCLLWGFWTSPSMEDFRVLMRAATARPIDFIAIAGVLASVATAAFVVRRWSIDTPAELGRRPWSRHPLLSCALPLAVVWVLGEPQFAGRMPVLAQAMLRDTRVAELNKYDAERLQRGYYEKIVGVNSLNGQLWDVYARAGTRTETENLADTGVMLPRSDALQSELRPLSSTVFKGGVLRTNRWGMRDREYERTAPPDTHRIAVLGQSYVMGSGVNDGEPFEALIEDRLNREHTGVSGKRYELLNFAVPTYSLMQDAIMMENGRVGQFSPDVILLVGHPSDLRTLTTYLWREIQFGRPPLESDVASRIDEAQITQGMSNDEATRRLRPHSEPLARLALGRIAAEARRLGARLVFALIPLPAERMNPAEKASILREARDAGFDIIDMEGVYGDRNPDLLTLSVADRHPNAEGHRVIAERLYGELIRIPGVLASRP